MTNKQLRSIEVKKLFGLYSYVLPEVGEFSDAVILYGDNGVGKSTLLRLVYHLLSPAAGRGHRNALFRIEFEELKVILMSGVQLVAKMQEQDDDRVLRLLIRKGRKTLAKWDFCPANRRARQLEVEDIHFHGEEDSHWRLKRSPLKAGKAPDSIPQGESAYLSELKKHVPITFILNAERRLDSDAVPDPSDEIELRNFMRYEAPKKLHELVVRSREIALSQALSAASKWIGRKAIKGTNLGSMNVHTVYAEVLRHVMSPTESSHDQHENVAIASLELKLRHIEDKMEEHEQYELATKLSTIEFRRALRSNKGTLAAELLRPYIESLEKRLEAVDPIYRVIDTFVKTVNNFLQDKELRFKLSQGFGIWNRLDIQLSPAQLSSGEQQLLLLFSYVLSARDEPSVFMIDEPEISLNIKWQRRLVESLLHINEDSRIQFVFASHSMELLAQHSARVVQLVDRS